MPLPQPKPRFDRLRRRVDPAPSFDREPPLRTYAFDPDAARKAWRQVARTRGAGGMRLDGRDPGRRLVPLVLGLVVIAGLALWFSGDDEELPTQAEVVVREGDVAPPPDAEDPEHDALAPAPVDPVPSPTFADEAEHVDELDRSPPPVPLPRPAPLGTSEQNAEALRKLPRSQHDRTPVGGIGSEGLHIDRITMGTDYDSGSCTGPVGQFSINEDDIAHVCFRAVHPRIEQRVIVHWERNGKLMRRTFVTIGDSHGYRTRAGLRLRRSYRGEWTARVMSTDGVELASHSFKIVK